WEAIPKILALAILLSPSSEKQVDKVRERISAAGGRLLSDFLDEEIGLQSRLAMLAKNDLALVAGIPTPPNLEKATSLILLDDRIGNTPEMKEAWNSALRILNLMQFSTQAHVALYSHPDMPVPKMKRSEVSGMEAWSDIYDLTRPELHRAIDALREADADQPTVGYELVSGNRVVAEAELASEAKKIAVLLAARAEHFKKAGWRIINYRTLIDDPNSILTLINESVEV